HDRRIAVEPGLGLAPPVRAAHQLLLRLRHVVPDLRGIVDVRVTVEDWIGLRQPFHGRTPLVVPRFRAYCWHVSNVTWLGRSSASRGGNPPTDRSTMRVAFPPDRAVVI